MVLEPIVSKLNKFLSKNKTQKIIQLIKDLEILLDQPEYNVSVTYILSVLVEHHINLVSQDILYRIVLFLNSDNIKLKVNSVIILGFFLITKPKLRNNYFQVFAKLLTDESKDIRDNVLFFFTELVNDDPDLINSVKDIIIESLFLESNKENIKSLLMILSFCKELTFDELFLFRKISKSLIASFHDEKSVEIYNEILTLIERFFPSLKEQELKSLDIKNLLDALESKFLMKKTDFTEISKNSEITLKSYLKELNNSVGRENKIYFYTKTKKNTIFIYELESNKLLNFFERGIKISNENIRETFSEIIQNDLELKNFVKTIIKLSIVDGYYSDIGFFYPTSYIKSNLVSDLKKNGIIKLKKFNFIPPQVLRDIIKDIRISQKDNLLLGKNKITYYSLKMIQEQVNREAAKNSVVDLKTYRERVTEEDFINLIKNLPQDYLSNYHKGTQWLTNIGTLRISKEIQSSKIFGFFDIPKNSKKLNIGLMLLFDVFVNIVDDRSGIWDKNKEVFYYSKYLTEKIENLSSISDESEKKIQIDLLAKNLNINKNHIETKLDENLKLIAKEIIGHDQIEIQEYLEKTGMDLEAFMKYIDELGIVYFRKTDLLIFKKEKIEEAKNDIRFMLLDKSKSVDFLNLGTFDIKSNLIKDLIFELLKDGKLKGIFYENEGEILFYTERGISSLMLENSFLFSFKDLFYGKELSLEEIDLMRNIFDDLISRKKLRGTFDEESLTFSSDEVLFAKDYNTVLFEFEKTVNGYIQTFELEYNKIKKILTKKEETIFPQEIKLIQEIIDKINGNYIWWRNGLDAFVRRANEKLLREQGVSVKKYKRMFSTEQKEEIKSFEEDPDVFDHLNNFKSWVKVFNKLEVKYPSVIFYNKRASTNPDDVESNKKLQELLKELFLS
ncbi:MAG: hypothetical protein ACW98X_06335 [Promethearchaeota archaeon]